ncbi:hypothetical protein FRB91_006979 [Serendipita sp. 411]|nr:hypothetical protein FRC15_003754 [Serendipita sp. 397]KAG8839471.1 hypothetical protein FRB91_006979 [Serendipita sp. 411]KAG8876301.1 hypothetical protein FRC20_001804 [Serendipita sp. 405]
MMSSPPPPPPPFYIMMAQSTAPGTHHVTASALQHPTVQLHYADDPPTALLPTAEHPNVLILESHSPFPEATSPPLSEPHLHSSSPPLVAISSAATITPAKHTITPPSVYSLSGNVAVTSVRVAQPPAAAVAYATKEGHDPNVYIIEYAPVRSTTHEEGQQRMEDSMRDTQSTAALLAQFHQKNTILRTVLESPNPRPFQEESESMDNNQPAASL